MPEAPDDPTANHGLGTEISQDSQGASEAV